MKNGDIDSHSTGVISDAKFVELMARLYPGSDPTGFLRNDGTYTGSAPLPEPKDPDKCYCGDDRRGHVPLGIHCQKGL